MAKIIVKTKREPPPRRVILAGKIVAVDFDGTLCASSWPDIGAPNVPLIGALREAKANGARLILWTCRTGEQLSAAVDWCRRFRLEFDAVNDNLAESKEAFGGDGRKIYADVYLDDKAVTPEEVVCRK